MGLDVRFPASLGRTRGRALLGRSSSTTADARRVRWCEAPAPETCEIVTTDVRIFRKLPSSEMLRRIKAGGFRIRLESRMDRSSGRFTPQLPTIPTGSAKGLSQALLNFKGWRTP